MRTRFLRTLAGAAAAPLLLGALAGCGDDADDDEIGTVAPTGTPEGQVAAEPPYPATSSLTTRRPVSWSWRSSPSSSPPASRPSPRPASPPAPRPAGPPASSRA